MSVLSPRLGIQVSSVYPTYTHIKGQSPLCVWGGGGGGWVDGCGQASRSRATLSYDSSYFFFYGFICI